MKSIIIFAWYDSENKEYLYEGGIYDGVSLESAADFSAPVGTVYSYIPLTVSGKTYRDKKNDLIVKAKEYQNTWADFCGFSYGELSEIQAFFEVNARRYGLVKEFSENGII